MTGLKKVADEKIIIMIRTDMANCAETVTALVLYGTAVGKFMYSINIITD